MDLLSIYLGLKQGSCLRPKTDVQSVDADSDFFFFFFFLNGVSQRQLIQVSSQGYLS